MDDSAARAQAGLTSTNDVTRATLAVATAQSAGGDGAGQPRARLPAARATSSGSRSRRRSSRPRRTTDTRATAAWKPDEVARRAEARRPDVRSAHEHTEALRDSARSRSTASCRRSALQAAAPPDHRSAAAGHRDLESAQLTLTWTIFDAGVRYADRTHAPRRRRESAALDERALRRSVATDIAIARRDAARRRATCSRSPSEAVAAAQKNTDETEILYKQGLARAIEVTDANASRYDAEVTRADRQARDGAGLPRAALRARPRPGHRRRCRRSARTSEVADETRRCHRCSRCSSRRCGGKAGGAAAEGRPARRCVSPSTCMPVEAKKVDYVVHGARHDRRVRARAGDGARRRRRRQVAFTEGQEVKKGDVARHHRLGALPRSPSNSAKAALDKAQARAEGRRGAWSTRREGASEDAPRPHPRRGARDLPDQGAHREGRHEVAGAGAQDRAAQPARLVGARADRRRHPDAHRRDRAVRAAGLRDGDAAPQRSDAAPLPGRAATTRRASSRG